MSARPVTLAPATDERRALDAAIDTVQFARAHNDRVIQQAYDFGDDLRLAHNERTPEAVEQELRASMESALRSMDMRGLVSVHTEPLRGAPVEGVSEVLTEVLDRIDSKEILPLFAALVAADTPEAARFRQAIASQYAQYNAEGIALARGYRARASQFPHRSTYERT